MTRDEFEAVVWRAISRPDERPPARRVRDILTAHDQAVTYAGGITAERRRAISAALSRREDQE